MSDYQESSFNSSVQQKSIEKVRPPPKSPKKPRKLPKIQLSDDEDSSLEDDLKLKFNGEEDESDEFELESNSSAMSDNEPRGKSRKDKKIEDISIVESDSEDNDDLKVEDLTESRKQSRKRRRKRKRKQPKSMIKNFRSSKTKPKK